MFLVHILVSWLGGDTGCPLEERPASRIVGTPGGGLPNISVVCCSVADG